MNRRAVLFRQAEKIPPEMLRFYATDRHQKASIYKSAGAGRGERRGRECEK
jgi:hypothetical protein